MTHATDFQPPRLLRNRHLQSLLGSSGLRRHRGQRALADRRNPLGADAGLPEQGRVEVAEAGRGQGAGRGRHGHARRLLAGHQSGPG